MHIIPTKKKNKIDFDDPQINFFMKWLMLSIGDLVSIQRMRITKNLCSISRATP